MYSVDCRHEKKGHILGKTNCITAGTEMFFGKRKGRRDLREKEKGNGPET